MTDARCEPPKHLLSEWGRHWITQEWGLPIIAVWDRLGWDDAEMHVPSSAVTAYECGWRYLAPVPSPEAVARLVEAGRRIGEAHDDRDIEPATSEGHKALAALLAALAAFPEDKT